MNAMKFQSAFVATPLLRQTGRLARLVMATAFFCLFLASQLAAADRPESFADLAERLSVAVVNISTTTVQKTGPTMEMPQFPPGSPFEEFFRDFDGENRTRRAQSLGSGFIVDASGIIVTNNHVIENADEIAISLADDTVLEAEIVGRDSKTDIAVLRIDPGDLKLQAVSFGDSDKMRVGDWVVAIGNPFGLGGTVTAGIVSARGRDIGSGPYDDFIQTDASINRGNSGGPLFNLEGEVIGINTAIFSQSGGSVGIGFAISSNLASQVVAQLQEYGRTRRGWLGVFIQEITPEIAESLGLKSDSGALVSAVTEGGPADAAGIEAGDVILSFNGRQIERMRDLPRIVAETPVEKTVPVELTRNGKNQTLEVTLGELERAENGGLLSSRQTNSDQRIFASLGLEVSQLTDALREEYDLDDSETGILITAVAEGSPAAEQGVSAGDVIRRLGQRPVTTLAELSAGIKRAKEAGRSGVLMLILSDGRSRFVQLSFGGE
jgi:serine protease Do